MQSELFIRPGRRVPAQEAILADLALLPLTGFSLIVSSTKVMVVPDQESRVQSYQPEEDVVGP